MPAGRRAAAGAATAALGGLLLGLAASCRDAPELLEPPELAPLGPAPYRLTYDPGRDVSPTWSASGDSILYVTEDLVPPVPLSTIQDTLRLGRPLRVIHREGGVASKVFPALQPSNSGTVALDFAVQSSDGRVAAFTLLPLLEPALCGSTVAVCDPPVDPSVAGEAPPRLSLGRLRVREPSAVTAPADDPQMTIAFPGRSFDTSEHPLGLSGLWRVDAHPFQRRFNATRRAPTRVSWAPEGDRLVFSDGVSLRIWDPDTGAISAIAGSADGVNPAWSPNGRWIAFERFERGTLTESTCEHHQAPLPPDTVPGPVICVEQRRSWPLLTQTVALIRPDGSGLRLLPEGSRPAWAADSRRVYYEAQGRIWSVAVDGSDAVPVPDTQNGFMPAPSPDGTQLAFAKIDPFTARSDIWIVSVEP